MSDSARIRHPDNCECLECSEFNAQLGEACDAIKEAVVGCPPHVGAVACLFAMCSALEALPDPNHREFLIATLPDAFEQIMRAGGTSQ
jgi:hypothetical protein